MSSVDLSLLDTSTKSFSMCRCEGDQRAHCCCRLSYEALTAFT
jgi:hypothetical protein